MGDYCVGGQSAGYALTTPRGRELCGEGGGQAASRGEPSGGSAVGSVWRFSGAGSEPADVNPRYAAQTLYPADPAAREFEVLRGPAATAAAAIVVPLDRIRATFAHALEGRPAGRNDHRRLRQLRKFRQHFVQIKVNNVLHSL